MKNILLTLFALQFLALSALKSQETGPVQVYFRINQTDCEKCVALGERFNDFPASLNPRIVMPSEDSLGGLRVLNRLLGIQCDSSQVIFSDSLYQALWAMPYSSVHVWSPSGQKQLFHCPLFAFIPYMPRLLGYAPPAVSLSRHPIQSASEIVWSKYLQLFEHKGRLLVHDRLGNSLHFLEPDGRVYHSLGGNNFDRDKLLKPFRRSDEAYLKENLKLETGIEEASNMLALMRMMHLDGCQINPPVVQGDSILFFVTAHGAKEMATDSSSKDRNIGLNPVLVAMIYDWNGKKRGQYPLEDYYDPHDSLGMSGRINQYQSLYVFQSRFYLSSFKSAWTPDQWSPFFAAHRFDGSFLRFDAYHPALVPGWGAERKNPYTLLSYHLDMRYLWHKYVPYVSPLSGAEGAPALLPLPLGEAEESPGESYELMALRRSGAFYSLVYRLGDEFWLACIEADEWKLHALHKLPINPKLFKSNFCFTGDNELAAISRDDKLCRIRIR